MAKASAKKVALEKKPMAEVIDEMVFVEEHRAESARTLAISIAKSMIGDLERGYDVIGTLGSFIQSVSDYHCSKDTLERYARIKELGV